MEKLALEKLNDRQEKLLKVALWVRLEELNKRGESRFSYNETLELFVLLFGFKPMGFEEPRTLHDYKEVRHQDVCNDEQWNRVFDKHGTHNEELCYSPWSN